MASISGEELSKHNTKDSCWLAINSTVWDVTDFVPKHPGGASLVLKLAGQDATEQYESFHDAGLVEEILGPEAKLGKIDASSIPKKPATNTITQDVIKTPKRPPLSSVINLHDFQTIAEKHMTPLAWAYISSGSDNEISLQQNAAAYSRIFLRGRILRPIHAINTSCSILGQPSSLPIYTCPVGLGKLVHPDGECCIAQADGKEGVIQVVNTVSSMPIERIMAARVCKEQPVFWQLYLDKDLSKSKAFVERVEKCGVRAIWLTVDSPVTGNRERDERFKGVDASAEKEEVLEDVVSGTKLGGAGIASSNNSFINGNVDWSIIPWLRSITKLPIVVKGIMCVEDAVSAYEHGVDGIVLSNHGGRSQDTSQPPLLTLLEIRTYAPHLIASKKFQIFVDGGVRRGTDVLKALCLGADAVGIGRPVLFSMSAGYGHYGIRRMIQILRREIETNMAFLGARTLEDLSPNMINTKPLENMMISSPTL
jgi:L-lactate dehydrogenase (cytochrome)